MKIRQLLVLITCVVCMTSSVYGQDPLPPGGGTTDPPADNDESCRDTDLTIDACEGETIYDCECTSTTVYYSDLGDPPIIFAPLIYTATSVFPCPEIGFTTWSSTTDGMYIVTDECRTTSSTHISVEDDSQTSICDQIANAFEAYDCKGVCDDDDEQCKLFETLTFDHEYTEDDGTECCIVTKVNDCECM